MCVTIPVRVVAVESADTALVESSGGTHRMALFGVPAGVGDWLLVHSGIALARIDNDDARERLAVINRGMGGPA